MAEAKEGSRERRTRAAEVVDAGSAAVNSVAKWTPQQALTVICVLLLSFLCAGFGAQLWIMQDQQKARERETREAFQALMREANAREELRALHCAQEAEKSRREFAETVKMVLAFQAQENAKLRAELVGALKERP